MQLPLHVLFTELPNFIVMDDELSGVDKYHPLSLVGALYRFTGLGVPILSVALPVSVNWKGDAMQLVPVPQMYIPFRLF